MSATDRTGEVRRLLKMADQERKKAGHADDLLLTMRLGSRVIRVSTEVLPRTKLFAKRREGWEPEIILTPGEENVLYQWLSDYKLARERAAQDYERQATVPAEVHHD